MDSILRRAHMLMHSSVATVELCSSLQRLRNVWHIHAQNCRIHAIQLMLLVPTTCMVQQRLPLSCPWWSS
jgi:hypothetical protein